MLENLLTNDGSRKVIRDLGLDEVITVTSSDDKHQVIQRIYLKYDSEVIVFEDIDPQEIADQKNHRHRLHQSNPQKLRRSNNLFFYFTEKANSFSYTLKSEARSATLNFLNAFDTTSNKHGMKCAFLKKNDILLNHMMSSE